MRQCSEFYITSAAWLLHLLDNCAAGKKVSGNLGSFLTSSLLCGTLQGSFSAILRVATRDWHAKKDMWLLGCPKSIT